MDEISDDSESYVEEDSEEETETEEEETDEEEEEATMPPKKQAAKKTSKQSSKQSSNATNESPVSALATSMQRTSLGFQLNPGFSYFSPVYTFPFKVAFTPYLSDGAMHCFVDLHVVTLHQSSFKVEVADEGNSIHLLSEVPRDFVQSERTANELHLQGDNDSIQCAQVVTTTFINKNYGTSTPIFSPSPQVIILPFQVERTMTINIVWADGDELLLDEFAHDPNIYDDERHQRMPFL